MSDLDRVQQDLLGLADYAHQRLAARLEGLTDEEYRWEPAPGCWSIREGADGRWVADGSAAVSHPAPFTTIAWRLCHVIGLLAGERNATWIGATPVGTLDRAGEPGTAKQALDELAAAYDLFRRNVDAADADGLTTPMGDIAGPYGRDTRVAFVLHELDELIHHGAEIAVLRDLYRATRPAEPIVEACLRGDRAAVESLLTEDPDLRSRHANLVADLAGRHHWDAVAFLVDLGFDVNASSGVTALHYAAGAGPLPVVRLLVEHGADTTATDTQFQVTPAEWAVHFRRSEVADYLVARGWIGHSLCVEHVVTAEFTDCRSGDAPLTWGQRGIWDAMGRNPVAMFNLFFDAVAPAGATPDAVAGAVGRVIARHEALRTTVRPGPDGEPRQLVAPAGRLVLETVACAPGAVPETLRAMRVAANRTAFDHGADLPLRVQLVTEAGVLRHIAYCFNHITVDEGAARIVLADVRALLTVGRFVSTPAPQPTDLARHEQDNGRAVTQRAVAYWTSQLRRVPQTMFQPYGPAHRPRTQTALLRSPALNAAGRLLAVRHGVSPTNVLLAATATMVAAWTGEQTSVLSVIVGNRFRPRYRYVVDNLQKLGLFALDLDDAMTFDEVVPRAWRAALLTYRNAYYDQRALDAASEQVRHERGAEINPFACFNGADEAPDPTAPAPPVDADEVRGLLPETTLVSLPNPSQVRCRFCLRTSGTGQAQVVRLRTDTAYLPPDHSAAFLRGLERLLVDAVTGPVTVGELRTRLRGVPVGA